MWTVLFLAEMFLRHALKAAERFLRSWYPLSRARRQEAAWAAVEAAMRADAALWAELADALGEDREVTVIRPVSRVRPYVGNVPVRWAS